MKRLFGSGELPPGVRRIFRMPWRRPPVRQNLDAELRFHLEMRMAELRAQGLTPDAAEAEARRRLGDDPVFRTDVARMDGRRAFHDRLMTWLLDLAHDLRLALRQAHRRPGLAALAVATLAIGIAAVLIAFSLVNSALYRALPYPLAGRSVAIIRSPFDWPGNLPPAAVEQLRHDTHSYTRVSAMYDMNVRLDLPNQALPLVATAVDTGFYATLGARPLRGRFPTAAEISAAQPYAVISYRLWHGPMNADPQIVGRSLRLGNHVYTIAGVMPPDINYGMQGFTDLWVPQPATRDTSAYYFAFAWLRPGVTLANARADARVLTTQLVQSDTARYKRLDMYVNEEMVIRRMSALGGAFLLFLAAAGCVLLIGCTNVATLLRMRATERRREMAIRASLGAGSARLVRQGLAESLLLTLLGTGLGAALAFVGIRWIGNVLPGHFPAWFRLGIDAHVTWFIAGVAVAVVLMVGLAPSLQARRLDVSRTLKAGGALGTTSAHTLRRGQRAIALQVAMAVALLVSTALLSTSYLNYATTDSGYSPDGVLSVWMQSDSTGPHDARVLSTLLASSPAVGAVAREAEFLRFQDSSMAGTLTDTLFRSDSLTAVTVSDFGGIRTHTVSPAYFHTLGIPLLRGRNFTAHDTVGTPLVALVSARVARTIWNGRGDVGRTFQLGRNGAPVTVIGVVGDIREPANTTTGVAFADVPEVYFSDAQAVSRPGLINVLVRPTQQGSAVAAITQTIRSATPGLKGWTIRSYIQTRSELPQVLQIFIAAIGSCAAIALALTLVGIYGVVGYSVAQRTREIGIRVALGGAISQVRRQVMWGSLRVAVVGLGIGVLLAYVLGHLLRTFLLGVSPASPAVYAVTCAIFAAAVYVAGYVPSRRATRVDPMEALRVE